MGILIVFIGFSCGSCVFKGVFIISVVVFLLIFSFFFFISVVLSFSFLLICSSNDFFVEVAVLRDFS